MAETSLGADEARRLVLAAQGFVRPGDTPSGPAGASGPSDVERLRAVLDTIHVLQIDAVNVLVRSHYIPAFSRLGPYARGSLDDLLYGEHTAFEHWGHAASVLPTHLHPLLRWRMDAFASHRQWIADISKDQLDRVIAEVTDRGPTMAEDLTDAGERGAMAWSLRPERKALTWLQRSGQLAIAGRGPNFQPRYDLVERVLPAEVLDLPTPDPDDARCSLLHLAASALGVATGRDLAEYFYLSMGTSGTAERTLPYTLAKPAELIDQLVHAERLLPVRVEGWRETAYMVPGIEPPGTVDAETVITPFDSLMWDRKRTARVFDFDYTLELYVPEPKRRFGYFVLPVLVGDRLVGRVDVRREGAGSEGGGALLVKGAYAEDGQVPIELADTVAGQIGRLASWLGLADVHVAERGNLAGALASRLR
jgi:hypothetical protein